MGGGREIRAVGTRICATVTRSIADSARCQSDLSVLGSSGSAQAWTISPQRTAGRATREWLLAVADRVDELLHTSPAA